ncbi:ATP-binding protein [Bacillus anthracis]|uniref:ATP-binding protein n=1 Tax=Bacillus anthracis TaxID=1392 RepID=UPI000750F7B9|nr:ATP-binding protein [Bacillus anthracis]
MTRIVNTSACSEETEGYTCEHCNKYIAAITVEVPQLRIKNKILPTCECVVEREEAKIREAHRNGSETAYKVAVKYVKTFKEWNGESLMLWGEPGNGKTHLAAAIVNELSKKGYIVVFQSVPELLQRIRSTFNSENKENETQIMRALLECDLLILDDIGAEKTTEWVEEKLFNIIDGRYRKELPTLYTSNLEPKELKNQVGKRSYDRMVETSLTVKNEAASYRREIAKQRLQRFIEA